MNRQQPSFESAFAFTLRLEITFSGAGFSLTWRAKYCKNKKKSSSIKTEYVCRKQKHRKNQRKSKKNWFNLAQRRDGAWGNFSARLIAWAYWRPGPPVEESKQRQLVSTNFRRARERIGGECQRLLNGQLFSFFRLQWFSDHGETGKATPLHSQSALCSCSGLLILFGKFS